MPSSIGGAMGPIGSLLLITTASATAANMHILLRTPILDEVEGDENMEKKNRVGKK